MIIGRCELVAAAAEVRVIPREGVERPPRHNLQNDIKINLVIPREGVERGRSSGLISSPDVTCDPERGS